MCAWCVRVIRSISWSWPNANVADLPSRSFAILNSAASIRVVGQFMGRIVSWQLTN
jgi:hypothetical protein